MKPTEEKKKDEKKGDVKPEEEKKEEPKKEPLTVPQEIRSNALLIDRAVSTLEPRFTLRVLRTLTALRKRLNSKVLTEAIEGVYPASTSSSSDLRNRSPCPGLVTSAFAAVGTPASVS